MTMHHAGIALAKDRLTKPAFQRSVINGELFSPQDAIAAGFLDRVVPVEQLMDTAQAMATTMKKINMHAHAKTKLKVRKDLLEALDAAIEVDKTIPL